MINRLKNNFKKITGVKTFLLCRRLFVDKPYFFEKIILINRFFADFKKYQKLNANKNFILSKNDLKPCLADKTDGAPINYVYFYQDAWCAKKIFESNPAHHYDIGSQAEFIGIISQFVPTTMIDIRPIDVKLSGLDFIKNDITALDFADNSLESISSICVIEHIGLGRYGDKLDQFGSEKAIAEIKRVLSPNGSLYISLPVDTANKIYFNAHCAFTRNYILKLFEPLKLMEEKYIYKTRLFDEYDKNRGFGTGLFHFKKTV